MKGAMKAQKFQKKEKKRFFFFFLIFLISLFPFLLFELTHQVFADITSNDNYSIDLGTIDTNPQPTPRQQTLKTHPIKENTTTGYDYSINSSGDTFSLGISQNTIDYGILSSTNPVIRTSDVSLNGAIFGSQLLGYENHPLQSSMKESIPNTTCDNGACTPLVAAIWNNTLTFGFGYRCDSNFQIACDPQFLTSDYYKTYPDQSINQPFDTIVIQNAENKTTKATITYKVNISGTQKTGGYYNSITYLAIPNF